MYRELDPYEVQSYNYITFSGTKEMHFSLEQMVLMETGWL